MPEYKVLKKYGRSPGQLLMNFDSAQEARHFIQTKLAEDARFKINATYFLYEDDELMDTMDLSNMTTVSSSGQESSQRSSGQTFSPSPLSTKPRPGGMPLSSFKDDEKKDE